MTFASLQQTKKQKNLPLVTVLEMALSTKNTIYRLSVALLLSVYPGDVSFSFTQIIP